MKIRLFGALLACPVSFVSDEILAVIYSFDQMSMINMTIEEQHQQLFETIEKGDLNFLKSLIEPPLTVNTVVFFFSN